MGMFVQEGWSVYKQKFDGDIHRWCFRDQKKDRRFVRVRQNTEYKLAAWRTSNDWGETVDSESKHQVIEAFGKIVGEIFRILWLIDKAFKCDLTRDRGSSKKLVIEMGCIMTFLSTLPDNVQSAIRSKANSYVASM